MSQSMSGNQKFNFAMKVLDEFEGTKLSNLAKDPGGLTYGGISQRWNPHVNVASLDEEGRMQFFHEMWVDNDLSELPVNIGAEMLEQIVQFGAPRAWTNAQLACTLLGCPIKVDGIGGPITLHTMCGLAERYEQPLLGALNGYQFLMYVDLMKRNRNLHDFAKSWMRRTIAKFDTLK